MASFTTISEALAAYGQWLPSQPLSTHTRRTYLTQVKQYCTYLSTFHWEYGHPLQEPHARDYAVRDYKTALKVAHLAKPSSVNLALAAVDHFYRFLELPTPQVTREDLPAQAPRALEPPEQKRFLRAVERCSSARDRAIALLLFYTDLRISECASLTMDDVRLSSRKGLVIVRMGKGNTYREVPLNAEMRTAHDNWLEQSKQRVSQRNELALFLTKQGTRLATRSIDDVVRRLGQEVHLSLSAHILRHTCITSLVRNGNDLCWWLNWPDTSGWKPHAATAYRRRQIARRRWKDSRWTTNARTFSDRCGTGAPDPFSSRGAPRRSRQCIYPVAQGHHQGLTAPRSTELPGVRLADVCAALFGLCAR